MDVAQREGGQATVLASHRVEQQALCIVLPSRNLYIGVEIMVRRDFVALAALFHTGAPSRADPGHPECVGSDRAALAWASVTPGLSLATIWKSQEPSGTKSDGATAVGTQSCESFR